MTAHFGFVPAAPISGDTAAAMTQIAAHCRRVAEAHMALAECADGLTARFLDDRRFRTGLRTLARHHRRAAWQYLEAARRAETPRPGCDDFDPADVMSA